MYTYLSGVQLLGQLALAVALAGSNIPSGYDGRESKAWRLSAPHPLARWFTVGVLAVQILSVLLAASLARVKHVALYDSEGGGGGDYSTLGGSGGQRSRCSTARRRRAVWAAAGTGLKRVDAGGHAGDSIAESPSRT